MPTDICSLPAPDPLSQTHMQTVQTHLQDLIVANGPITFASYMQAALYAPGLGYYSAGRTKLGKSGDFVTAPEISSLFGQCIAEQCAQVLTEISDGVIFEFGAGTGKLAFDIISSLIKKNTAPKNYFILEVSADLRQRQQIFLQQQLPDYFEKIIWLDQLPSKPINAVIIANEVIDAMPVEIFQTSKKLGTHQAYVSWHDGNFKQVWQPASEQIKQEIDNLHIDFADDYTSEINLNIKPWIKSLEQILNQGLILLIDYGFPEHEFYHADRHMGTLMCHYQHHAHSDPYILPGIQDITAHVNFTALADAADQDHLQIEGFTTQAAFLLNCGITQLLQKTTDNIDQYNLNQQLTQLTSPAEMGELFKVLVLSKQLDIELLGLRQFNQIERL